MDQDMEKWIKWILIVLLIPIAFLVLILMTLFNFLRFLLKAALLFIIVAIYTPIAVMCNVSILMVYYKISPPRKSNDDSLKWSDPRSSVGIEVQLLISDFFKVIAGELLLVLSAGVITFYTAPKQVFYISMTVGIVAILLKWLNTNSLSKTAFSCLCDGYGLNPIMFLFRFLGLFDIGCHPIAKCSFSAKKAFIFVKEKTSKQCKEENGLRHFEDAEIFSKIASIEFLEWNAFERGLFQLTPRINFIIRENKKYILKSYMILKLLGKNLCEYPVERLELPEDYSKANQLFNFLKTLSEADGFVTDKMRGRYEHSLTLLEIVDGVEENYAYRTVDPLDSLFVVAKCNDLQ